MPLEPTGSSRNLRNATRAFFYLSGSFFLLYPVLSSPVIADDFVTPFYQGLFYKRDGWSAFLEALSYGWRSGTEGANFRVLGSTIGSLWLWLWLTVGAHFDISMTTLYALTKYVVYLGCAASLASFWWVVSREYGRGIRYWDALVMTSFALFATIQNHGLWSSDPVASFPLAGYGSAAIGFAALSCAVLAVRQQSRRSFLLAAGMSLASVLYYEINLGAVLGVGVILAAGCWLHRDNPRLLFANLAGGALVVGLPVLVLLFGRTVAMGNSVSYGGTVFRLAGTPRTFFLGVLNSLPGSAWTLSERQSGGRFTLAFFSLGVLLLLVWLLRWWLQTSSPWDGVSHGGGSHWAMVKIAIGVGVATYALGAIGLQAMTVKVQDETLGLGYVYTYYAVSSCAVALAIAVAARYLFSRRNASAIQFLMCSVAVIFLVIQSTVSWGVTKKLNGVVAPNRRLLNTFDVDVDQAQRCQALAEWTAGGWPDSYEIDMVAGLQHSYKVYFGELFCKGFFRAG